MRGSVSTPWGQSDDAGDAIAPGIVWYDTPSHGGFHLDEDRQAKVLEMFPHFQTFAGGPWYEEDCDWVIVVLAFPEHFGERQRATALECAKRNAQREVESLNEPRPQYRDWKPSGWCNVVERLQTQHTEVCVS